MFVQKAHLSNYLNITPNLTQLKRNQSTQVSKSHVSKASSILIEEHDAATLKNSGLWHKLTQRNRQLHFHVIPNQQIPINTTDNNSLETTTKHQILTHIAHEVNTPLAGITGLIHLLDGDPDPTILDGEMWQMLKKSVQRINHTISNILLYEQLKQDLFTAEKQTTNHATDLLREHIERLAHQHKRFSDVQFNHLPNCSVNMPKHLFLQVIEEIFNNAMAYSDAQSMIKINAYCTPGYLHVCINDKGRGFTKAQLRQLGAYKQFNRSVYEQQGLGLGVHLSYLLLAKFDGAMHITSAQNEGTEVCLSFPR